MMKKTQYATFILVALCILSGMLVAGHDNTDGEIGGGRETRDLVYGNVLHSNDSIAKILDDNRNWVCGNITTYCVEDYENGTVDFAIGNATTNAATPGDPYSDQDYFRFVPDWLGAEADHVGKAHIAIGESYVNDTYYVFVTNFTYITIDGNRRGNCAYTEWEPIPTPSVYLNGTTWINLSIPKFKNPQKKLYGNLTTNSDNTIGFAVYRSKTNKDYLKVGETIYSEDSYYYFNDTNLSPRTSYYYAVAPIANGGYITYYKSQGAELSTTPLVTVNSPNGGEDWSGNKSHIVSYTIHACEPPYAVNLSYSVDGINWTWFNTTICDRLGTHIYNWTTPSIDSKTVRIGINVTDNKLVTDFDTSNNPFEIDSTPPTIENTLPGNGSSCSPSASLVIEFDEPMNETSVEEAFSYTNGNKIWTSANGTIIWLADNVIQFTPNENFELGMQYNCTLSVDAKDDSQPGNAMIKDYIWSFVAAPGHGNFSVDVDYPPSKVVAGCICQIKVRITNALDAENKSGGLIVKVLKSSNGIDFSIIDIKTVSEMFPGDSTTGYANFSLPEGTWYLKVNITSTNPADIIEGFSRYYETPIYTIDVLSPEEWAEEKREIGPGPYALIVLMVLLVIVIGFLVIAGYKKESEKKEKPAEEEGEEKKEE